MAEGSRAVPAGTSPNKEGEMIAGKDGGSGKGWRPGAGPGGGLAGGPGFPTSWSSCRFAITPFNECECNRSGLVARTRMHNPITATSWGFCCLHRMRANGRPVRFALPASTPFGSTLTLCEKAKKLVVRPYRCEGFAPGLARKFCAPSTRARKQPGSNA